MSILHIDSLSKNFGEKIILQNIFLSCKTGDIVGILGRNGCGKSTLFNIIFGTVKSDFDFIKIDQTILKNQWSRRNKIAYLPQHHFLPKNISVINALQLFCSDTNTKIISDLEYIKPFLEERTKNLSSGELRIVETLVIIFSDHPFALLDEPFHSISPKIVSDLKIFIQQQSKNKGFIISDHSYQDVLDICNRNYLLKDANLREITDFNDLKKFNYIPK